MSAPLVELRDVRFRRPGGFALEVGELLLAPAERVALVGPSGAGKSTLLQLVAGILTPERGSVRVAGQELAGARDADRRRLRRERLGLVFQELELVWHLDAETNALLPWILGAPRAELAERRRELARCAEDLGIAPLLDRLPRALSQGERQRVAIARALLGRPALVLADEPTGNLDRDAARRAVALLCERAEAAGSALVLVTHDPEPLARFERVLCVERREGGAACVS